MDKWDEFVLLGYKCELHISWWNTLLSKSQCRNYKITINTNMICGIQQLTHLPLKLHICIVHCEKYPDSKVHVVLSAPGGPHVGPMNLAIRVAPISLMMHICIGKTYFVTPSKDQTRTTRTPAFWGYPQPSHDYPHYWVMLDPKSKWKPKN